MSILIDETEMLDILHEFVRSAGTQQIAAEQLGISAAYMSDMFHGRRSISEGVAEKLGYRRSWMYELVIDGTTKKDENSQT